MKIPAEAAAVAFDEWEMPQTDCLAPLLVELRLQGVTVARGGDVRVAHWYDEVTDLLAHVQNVETRIKWAYLLGDGFFRVGMSASLVLNTLLNGAEHKRCG